MPTTFQLFILLLLAAAFVYLAVKISRLGKSSPDAAQGLNMLQQQISQLQKEIGDRMGETHQAVRQSFAASTGVVRDVTEKLTRMEETTKQVLDITGQLQNLQDMLKNPKQRGILGEYYLETLLINILPPDSYEMQYKFKDGEIVDAAVFIKDKIVPIDSKFSLENYNRMVEEQNPAEREKLEKLFINDLKERIKETAKYVRPEEGTMDFAFMFIPHEAIYYDLLINKIGPITGDTESIIQRAAGKYHVLIVSPTSFLAYLQTVLQGLKALKIEEQAKEIRVRVGDLSRHLSAYDSYFKSLGKNLGTAVNQYNLASKEFTKIDKDVLRITGSSNQTETLQIDKPQSEEL
ncbi:DNA recombination protein RmuC [Patescibacteria group bacterium]|nr:DNA recombination protein RmuC [Patescibacteria group bacterium]MBU1034472.1 DNA recombination protein RmuC [Patescibacteria group bacterium]MBU1630052.1 DNA recombination protein RmuC [Patescibacteria group bacterium]MBU1907693.1 DNA recombination protein RmuC [Patescibacteria group bacterium]